MIFAPMAVLFHTNPSQGPIMSQSHLTESEGGFPSGFGGCSPDTQNRNEGSKNGTRDPQNRKEGTKNRTTVQKIGMRVLSAPKLLLN